MRHSKMERSDAQNRRSASASDTPSLDTARDFLADAFRRRPVAYRNELWTRYKRASQSDNRARFDEALAAMIAAGNVFEVRDAHGRKQYTMDRPRRVTVTPPAAHPPVERPAPGIPPAFAPNTILDRDPENLDVLWNAVQEARARFRAEQEAKANACPVCHGEGGRPVRDRQTGWDWQPCPRCAPSDAYDELPF